MCLFNGIQLYYNKMTLQPVISMASISDVIPLFQVVHQLWIE